MHNSRSCFRLLHRLKHTESLLPRLLQPHSLLPLRPWDLLIHLTLVPLLLHLSFLARPISLVLKTTCLLWQDPVNMHLHSGDERDTQPLGLVIQLEEAKRYTSSLPLSLFPGGNTGSPWLLIWVTCLWKLLLLQSGMHSERKEMSSPLISLKMDMATRKAEGRFGSGAYFCFHHAYSLANAPICLLYRPAPHSDFWRNNTYSIVLPGGRTVSVLVNLDLKHQACRIPSPIQPNISFPAEVVSFPLA